MEGGILPVIKSFHSYPKFEFCFFKYINELLDCSHGSSARNPKMANGDLEDESGVANPKTCKTTSS